MRVVPQPAAILVPGMQSAYKQQQQGVDKQQQQKKRIKWWSPPPGMAPLQSLHKFSAFPTRNANVWIICPLCTVRQLCDFHLKFLSQTCNCNAPFDWLATPDSRLLTSDSPGSLDSLWLWIYIAIVRLAYWQCVCQPHLATVAAAAAGSGAVLTQISAWRRHRQR